MSELKPALASGFTPDELALIGENEAIAVEMFQLVGRLEVLKRRLDANCGYVAPPPLSWPPRANIPCCTDGAP
jgi:hypothetical protein